MEAMSRRAAPRSWCARILVLLAMGAICLMGGCTEAGQPDVDASLTDVTDAAGDRGQDDAPLTLQHGVFSAGGTPMMSDRFELVGHIAVSAQNASSDRFTLQGGF